MTKTVSKQKVAQQYFSSLEKSMPLRERVDATVDHMKMEFVNGQTERVVFNYIRDEVNTEGGINTDLEILKQIVQYKISIAIIYATENEEEWFQKRVADYQAEWIRKSPEQKLICLLAMVDLYTDKSTRPILRSVSNRLVFQKDGKKICFGESKCDAVSTDNGWMSATCSGSALVRNYFPFFTKDQLENPIALQGLSELSKGFLKEGDEITLRELISAGHNCTTALKFLEENEVHRETEARSEIEESEPMLRRSTRQRQRQSQQTFDKWWRRFWIGIPVALVVCFGVLLILRDTGTLERLNREANGLPPRGAGPVVETEYQRLREKSSNSALSSYERRQLQTEESIQGLPDEQGQYVRDKMKEYDRYCADGGSGC